MECIKVVHLSDLHLSEADFWKGVDEKSYFPLKSGHDPKLLIALDKTLKKLDYDLLLISGDCSRVGHEDSFGYLKTWLFSKIKAPNGLEIGLGIDENAKKCFIVPGNHDRFNNQWIQSSLSNYNRFFTIINDSAIVKTQVRGIQVNLHLYDSSFEKGGFAHGYIEPASFLRNETTSNGLDIVLLHHHLAQPPNQKRKYALELLNTSDFLMFLLAEQVDAILFGHTHEGYFDVLSADLLRDQILYKGKVNRLLSKILPKKFCREKGGVNPINYHRRATKNGKFTTMEKYFEYLYIKNILRKNHIMGPECFDKPKHFYDHIDSYKSDYHERMNELKKRKIAFSMAPSPCCSEKGDKGFNYLTFTQNDDRFIYKCDEYRWDNNDFYIANCEN